MQVDSQPHRRGQFGEHVYDHYDSKAVVIMNFNKRTRVDREADATYVAVLLRDLQHCDHRNMEWHHIDHIDSLNILRTAIYIFLRLHLT